MPNRSKFKAWLESLELQFNPFEFLDAGADYRLSTYLIGHDKFAAIWDNRPSAMFAPAGGGKSAFRVRLARACRVEQDGRRIFPILYKVRDPAEFEGNWPPLLDKHLGFISQAAASEMLLALSYRPSRYLKLDEDDKKIIRYLLKDNLPLPLEYFLAQVDEAGDLSPLIETFDPTAAQLISSPTPDILRQLCADLRRQSATGEDQDNNSLQQLIQVIMGPLGYEAVYLLVDGVDAYWETVNDPEMGVTLIQPLLEQTSSWARDHIYAKYFLPQELEGPVRLIINNDDFDRLDPSMNFVKIEWTPEMLIEVLQERLKMASNGRFNSFDAISNPSIRRVEEALADTIAVPLPREIIVLAGNLLEAHFQRTEGDGKLEQADLVKIQEAYDKSAPVL